MRLLARVPKPKSQGPLYSRTNSNARESPCVTICCRCIGVKMEYNSPMNLPSDIKQKIDAIKEHFPELGDLKIHIVYRPLSFSTMTCRPSFLPAFPWQSRRYVLSVNSGKEFKKHTLPIRCVEAEILDAWIAHELCHIIQYERMSFWEIVKLPFRYFLNLNFRKNFETECDLLAISKGFGEGLKKGQEFVASDPRVSAEYKKTMEKFYYTFP